MSSEQLDLIKATLAEALNHSPSERAEFLAHCDAAVRTQVETLLDLHDRAGDFLNLPLPQLLGIQEPPITQIPSGTVINERYQVSGILTRSGFATLYRALDLRLADRPVVLKVLDQIHQSAPSRATFQREVTALSQLRHANIVAITDAGALENGTPFLVLDFVPGVSLRDELRSGALGVKRAISILFDLGQALKQAHQLGILHLDVKPENVILSEPRTPNERATLIDFGIARIKGFVQSDLLAGSPHYMAPEQAGSPSLKSDIYALGRVAFEMLTGDLPQRHILAELPRSVPRRTALAIQRALEHDPEKRQESVAEFLADLPTDPASLSGASHIWGVDVILATALVAALVLAPLKQSSSRDVSWRPVPFVTSGEFDFRPAFSPDGAWLYYASGPNEHHGIRKKLVLGGDSIAVTNSNNIDDHPEVSPDGRRLTFIRSFPLESAIYVRDTSSSGSEVEVARSRAFDSVTWTPDSRLLLVGESDSSGIRKHFQLIDPTSGRRRELRAVNPSFLDRLSRPAFSPDGKQLAWIRAPIRTSAEIVVARIGPDFNLLEAPRIIARHSERIEEVHWTPDGRDLLYVAGTVNSGTLWRVNIRYGKPSQLLLAAGRIASIAIPSKAWNLAYALNLSDTNVWRLDLRTDRATRVIGGSYDDEEAHLSPDGQWVLFGSGRTGDGQVWLAKPDGSEQRQFSRFRSVNAIDQVWMRDSKHILLSIRSREQGQRIFRTPLDSFAPQELSPDGMATSVSRDGRWIYFRRNRNGAWHIFRMNVARPQEVESISDAGAYHAVESCDGKWLYYTRRDESEGIWKQPLPRGPAVKIVDQVYRRNLFAPGKAGLYYVDTAPGDVRQALYFKSFSDSKSSVLHIFEHQVFWGLDLAPDEHSVLFSQYDVSNYDILLIPEFH